MNQERLYIKKLLSCILKLLKEYVTFDILRGYECSVYGIPLYVKPTKTLISRCAFAALGIFYVILGEKEKNPTTKNFRTA